MKTISIQYKFFGHKGKWDNLIWTKQISNQILNIVYNESQKDKEIIVIDEAYIFPLKVTNSLLYDRVDWGILVIQKKYVDYKLPLDAAYEIKEALLSDNLLWDEILNIIITKKSPIVSPLIYSLKSKPIIIRKGSNKSNIIITIIFLIIGLIYMFYFNNFYITKFNQIKIIVNNLSDKIEQITNEILDTYNLPYAVGINEFNKNILTKIRNRYDIDFILSLYIINANSKKYFLKDNLSIYSKRALANILISIKYK